MSSTDTFLVRIGHFVPDAPALDVLVDGHPVLTGVGFGDVNDYTEHRADAYAVAAAPADGGDPLVETDVAFEAGEAYTLLFVGTADEPSVRLLADGA